MKRFILSTSSLIVIAGLSSFGLVPASLITVPPAVKEALVKKYPSAKHVNWEKEKGNFEGNWGGASKEDTSVVFTPAGDFVEEVIAIPVSILPPVISSYVRSHYSGARIKEAGKVTDAKEMKMFEAEIKGKDLIFDENGKFLKED